MTRKKTMTPEKARPMSVVAVPSSHLISSLFEASNTAAGVREGNLKMNKGQYISDAELKKIEMLTIHCKFGILTSHGLDLIFK